MRAPQIGFRAAKSSGKKKEAKKDSAGYIPDLETSKKLLL